MFPGLTARERARKGPYGIQTSLETGHFSRAMGEPVGGQTVGFVPFRQANTTSAGAPSRSAMMLL